MDNQDHRKLLRLYRLGMLMFALQAVYFSFVIYDSYQFQMEAASVASLDHPFIIDWNLAYLSLAVIVTSLILTFITYRTLYLPEKERRVPSKRKLLVASMGVLGCFFGLIIGGLAFAGAYSKIEEQMLH